MQQEGQPLPPDPLVAIFGLPETL